MIGYRKVNGQWVEVDLLKVKELRTRASRHRNERIIAQAQRAQQRLDVLRASCTHDVIMSPLGPNWTGTKGATCAICGKSL